MIEKYISTAPYCLLSLLISTPKKEIWWWYSSSMVNCVKTIGQMGQKGIHSCFPMKLHCKSVIHILCLTHTHTHTHTCRYVVPWPARLYDWYSLSLFTTVLALIYVQKIHANIYITLLSGYLLGKCPSKPSSGGGGHLEGAEQGRDFVDMEFTKNLWGPNVFLHLNRD